MTQRYRTVLLPSAAGHRPAGASTRPDEAGLPFSLAALDLRSDRLRCVVVAHRPTECLFVDGRTLEISFVAPCNSMPGGGEAGDFLAARAIRLARRRGLLRAVSRDPAGLGWRTIWTGLSATALSEGERT